MKNVLLLFLLLVGISGQVISKNYPSADDKAWKKFFKEFKAAVSSGNKDLIYKMTDFSAIDKEDFDSVSEIFFEGEAKEKFAKAKSSDAKPSEQEFDGLGVAKDCMQLSFEEKGSDDEGNVYESALIFYFAKVKGKYKLVYLMAAG
jgi:hypothetical protein